MAVSSSGDANRLSHASLISAPSQEAALRKARELAKAAVCSGDRPPCGVCRDCRKAEQGVHPDIALISRETDDKGKPRKEIVVDQIRRLSADAALLPNEAERKVYIICEADAMNPAAQNAALKLFEEPPRNVIFLLCAVNPELLLPTVRSRCTAISAGGQTQAADPEREKLASEYLRLAASRDRAKLFSWCAGNDGMDTRSAAAFIACVDAAIADALCSRRRIRGLSEAELMGLHRLMERCSAYLRVNTGVKHRFGLLAVGPATAAETEDE